MRVCVRVCACVCWLRTRTGYLLQQDAATARELVREGGRIERHSLRIGQLRKQELPEFVILHTGTNTHNSLIWEEKKDKTEAEKPVK